MTLRTVLCWLAIIITALAIGLFGYVIYQEVISAIYSPGIADFNEPVVKVAGIAIVINIVNFFVLVLHRKK